MENQMAKKYIVTEGILTKFVSSVMDNIVDGQRQKNKKMLKKAHDAKLVKLEAEAAQAVKNFTDYIESNIKNKDKLKNL
jgi:hypothetical protein